MSTPTNITNRQLLQWDSEAMRMNGSIIGMFNRSKIQEFYRNNEARISTLKRDINELQDDYFVVENDQVKYEGEGNDKKPVMKEGKTLEEYQQKFKELQDKIVSINI